MADNVNHPSHYADNCSLECCDVMQITFGLHNYFMFCIENAFKYLWRHKYKNGKEDLDKARWYLWSAEKLFTERKNEVFFIDDEMTLKTMLSMYIKAKREYENEETIGC